MKDIIKWIKWEPGLGEEDATYSYLRYDNFSDCAI